MTTIAIDLSYTVELPASEWRKIVNALPPDALPQTRYEISRVVAKSNAEIIDLGECFVRLLALAKARPDWVRLVPENANALREYLRYYGILPAVPGRGRGNVALYDWSKIIDFLKSQNSE